MYKLGASLLSSSIFDLSNQINILKKNGVDYLHIDVMDGHFVNNLAFGHKFLKDLKKNTNMFLDVHLMTTHPSKWIWNEADKITFHIESQDDPFAIISKIREKSKQVGIAVNPSTKIEEIYYLLDKIDSVLIMTVNPGFGGQKLIPECMDKIKKLKLKSNKLGFSIQVDGGIDIDNFKKVLTAGADSLVVGSALFRNNIIKNLSIFKNTK